MQVSICLLRLHDEQFANKVFSFFGNAPEGLVVEAPVAGFDMAEGLFIVGSTEGRQATQAERDTFGDMGRMGGEARVNVQNVGEDTDRPHVGVIANWVSLGDLGSGEFGGSCRHLDRIFGIQLARQAEIDQFQFVASLRREHNVLWLKFQLIMKRARERTCRDEDNKRP